MSNHKTKPAANTFAALHSKCMNGAECAGPGCRRTRDYDYSTAEPRQRTTPTKAERRLAARVAGWELTASGKDKPEHGQRMHRPGSQTK